MLRAAGFKKRFFLSVILLNIFILIPQAYPQDNHYALQYLRRSLECLALGDFTNAIINSNQVLRIDPNSALSLVVRARAYYELNYYTNAIADCTQALRIDRGSSAAYLIRGNAYGQNGDYNRAISDWQAALRINPELEEAAHNIEVARRQMNQ